MPIGLCGAHRTGKTTLARIYADKFGVDFLETRSSKVFERLGLDPKASYNFWTRLNIQEEILADAVEVYRSASGEFITDRTPIDMMAYTLADIQRANLSDEDTERAVKYMERCIKATNMYFSTLILVQPGIQIVEEAGKAPGNMAYIEHLNSLIMGLIVDERIRPAHFYIPRRFTTVEDRLDSVESAVRIATRKVQAAMEGEVKH